MENLFDSQYYNDFVRPFAEHQSITYLNLKMLAGILSKSFQFFYGHQNDFEADVLMCLRKTAQEQDINTDKTDLILLELELPYNKIFNDLVFQTISELQKKNNEHPSFTEDIILSTEFEIMIIYNNKENSSNVVNVPSAVNNSGKIF